MSFLLLLLIIKIREIVKRQLDTHTHTHAYEEREKISISGSKNLEAAAAATNNNNNKKRSLIHVASFSLTQYFPPCVDMYIRIKFNGGPNQKKINKPSSRRWVKSERERERVGNIYKNCICTYFSDKHCFKL